MVFFISGLSGSGKTVAGEFFTRHGIPVIRMGEVTRRFLTLGHRGAGEPQEEAARRVLREQHGPTVYAQRTLPYVARALKTSPSVAIEGIRSMEEWRCFQQALPARCLIYIQTETLNRHRRLTTRTVRPLTEKEIRIRDTWEQEVQVEKLTAVADHVIENNGTKEELYEKLKKIMKNRK